MENDNVNGGDNINSINSVNGISSIKSRLSNINLDNDNRDEDSIDVDEPQVQQTKITPIYLGDEEPPGESNWVKWALLHGYTEEDLKDAGKNPGTIRICAQELERDGYRKRPPKKAQTAITKAAQSNMKVFSKAGPPEALLDSISLPMEGREAQIFENGLKSGMSLVILGVRVAQELSSIGVQQAKPIMEMAKSMREGEAVAAKTSASEAAQEAAVNVSRVFAPAIEALQETVSSLDEKTSKASSNPLQDMVARTMEPLFKNMMNMMMPGMGGMGGMMGGQPQQSGWTVEQEGQQ
jgi:hypothetical protein